MAASSAQRKEGPCKMLALLVITSLLNGKRQLREHCTCWARRVGSDRRVQPNVGFNPTTLLLPGMLAFSLSTKRFNKEF